MLSKLIRSAGRERWVIGDQAVVSTLNFVTGILLVRYMGLQQYGVFVLLYAALLYVNTVQGNLILAPMMSLAPQCDTEEERKRFLSGVFTLQLVLALVFAIGLFAFGLVVSTVKPAWQVRSNIVALVVTAVSFQAQDWLRRYFFVLDRACAAFWNDVVSYLGQIVVFVAIAKATWLTPAAAMFAVGGTSALAFFIGMPIAKVRVDVRAAKEVFHQIWRVSRDLFLAGQMQWVGSQGVLLIGASMLGTIAAGGIRAAQNISGPFNVMFGALENFMPVRAAQRYRAHGRAGVVHFLKMTTIVGTIALGAVFVVISVFSPWLLSVAYGPAARKYAAVVIWQLVYLLFGFIWRQLIYFHRTVGTTSSMVWSNAVACVVTIAATPLAFALFREAGAMIAITAGELACIAVLIWKVRAKVPAKVREEIEVCAM